MLDRKENNHQAENKSRKTIKRAGIEVLGSFIIGFLGETVNSVRQTISFAKN